MAFRKDADRPATIHYNISADSKTHPHAFFIYITVLRQLAESFEKFGLIGRVDSATRVSYCDS